MPNLKPARLSLSDIWKMLKQCRCVLEDCVRILLAVIVLPFKAAALVWLTAEKVAQLVILGLFRLIFGLFGLAFVAFFGFALTRFLLAPFF